MSQKSFRQAFCSQFCYSAVNGAFAFRFFLGLEFSRDVSDMCSLWKSNRTGEAILVGLLSKLPPVIDSWPCRYSPGIWESSKLATSTKLVTGVLFRIGTGHSIIFTDLDELVPLLGSRTRNIPFFFAFSFKRFDIPLKFSMIWFSSSNKSSCFSSSLLMSLFVANDAANLSQSQHESCLPSHQS